MLPSSMRLKAKRDPRSAPENLPSCRFCGSPLAHLFVDLGAQPPSNAYLDAAALGRMEARNPRKAKHGWSVEAYVDRVLTADMLPIDTDYALSLFEAFIVMDAVEAAVDADGAG